MQNDATLVSAHLAGDPALLACGAGQGAPGALGNREDGTGRLDAAVRGRAGRGGLKRRCPHRGGLPSGHHAGAQGRAQRVDGFGVKLHRLPGRHRSWS